MSELKKVIYKYEVPIVDEKQHIDLPFESEIIHVACQVPDKVAFWAEVYLHDGVPRTRKNGADFIVLPTGGEVPMFAKHVGTALSESFMSSSVWHLYRFDDR